MNAGEFVALSYSMLMVVFGLLFWVKVLVRCGFGASVLVVLCCVVVRFGVVVLVERGLVVLCVGVSVVWCVFGGLSGMFLIVVLIESLRMVLFFPSSEVRSMLVMMSETAGSRAGILW